MRALVLGTSNCIIKAGLNRALYQHFGASNVTNLSLGGSSGTFLALCRFIEGVDLARYDYVFLDSLINEQWQVRAGKSAEHLRNVARVLYGALPPGPTYVYVGFGAQPSFYRADSVELFHRAFCSEAGVHFFPLRELLAEFGAVNAIARHFFFKDSSHFKPVVVAHVIGRFLGHLPSLPKKTQPALIGREHFFVQDLIPQAVGREAYATSLRRQEYGVFTNGMTIAPARGCFLGFDFVAQNTDAFMRVHAETGRFCKALNFNDTNPWMKVAGFYSEVMTGPLSSVQIVAEVGADEGVEGTEATSPLTGPISGEARLSNFFFAAHPVSQLGTLFRLSGALPHPAMDTACDAIATYMQAGRRHLTKLLTGVAE